MLKWYKLEEELPESDFVKQINVSGKKLCLIKEQGEYYAVQNTCPHAGGILSGGWCRNGHLVCPIHRWEYNLKTGRGATGQGDYINTYPLEKRKDGLYIGIKESWIKQLFS
ncbi:3-phenylpropionate/trans-cinnamate dioxygenase ferredoxin subunit [Pedobacter sp. CAN_A7]|uniref:Rieske (2Fe-2S) protein n=1 Tax=Pedobacter sp. CAN_A7 TaxID=2787722 RepID=UPI0018CA4139